MRDLGELAGFTGSTAVAINNSGQVVGQLFPAGFGVHGVLWTPHGVEDLGNFFAPRPVTIPLALNERGQIVGGSEISLSRILHAFLWQHDVLQDLGALDLTPGHIFSQANAVNERGDVVGYGAGDPSPDTRHAVLWRRAPGGPHP